MFDDLILIGGISILALIAHGCRHQMWLQWILRVFYCMFLLGEVIWLLASAGDPATTSLSVWAASFVAIGTGLILFKPFRVALSYVLTVVNQIIVGRPLLAAMGLLHLPPPLAASEAESSSSPVADAATAPAAPLASESGPASEPGPEAEPGSGSEPGPEAEPSSGSEPGPGSEPGSASESGLGAELGLGAEPGSASESGSGSESGPVSERGSASASASGDSQALSGSPAEPASPAKAEVSTTVVTAGAAVSTVPFLAPGGNMTVVQSLLAERIFAPASIPHLNAAWVYITTFGYLLSRTDFQVGLQMPAMPFSMPVTAEQLLFYNGLGLVILAVCGVGIFVARNPKATLERLGLVKPTWTQVFIGLGMVFFTFFYDWAWSNYTHAQTGMGYASKLTGYNEGTFKADGNAGSAFVLALAVGFFAGVGEETLIRGAVQPVFGALPAGILHGILHSQFEQAPIYILQVAAWSTIMGIVRRYTNTTTTIICHFTYNFLTTFLFAFNPQP